MDKHPIIYKPGRALFGMQVRGLKVHDPYTMADTYEDNLVADDYGVKTDPIKGQYDYDHRRR